MIQKIKSISKRTLSVVLTLMLIVSTMLVGMVTANAATDFSGYIYFVKPDEWTDSVVQLMIGHSSYSRGVEMTKIDNTDNLYYTQGESWSDSTEVAFFNTGSVWSGENSTISDRSEYTTNYTATYTSALSSGNYYVVTPASGSKGASITVSNKGTTYSSLNLRQDVNVQTSTDGATYTNATTSPADVSISGYQFGTNSTCSVTRSDSVTKGGTDISLDGSMGYLANTTLSVSNIQSGYTFVGWYDSSNNLLSDSITYTYNPTSINTISARFKQSGYAVTCNEPTNGTLIASTNYATSGTDVTFTATANEGYELDTLTIGGSKITSGITTAGNVSTYKYTMGSATVEASVTFKKSNYNVTLNQAIGGTISADKTTAQMGDTVTITASPDTDNDYKLTGITVTSSNGNVTVSGIGNTRTFTMPASNVTVTPTFAKNTYTIGVSYIQTFGSVKTYVNGTESTNFSYGDIIKIVATANTGYELSGITVDGEAYTNNTEFTANSKATINVVATFVAKTYNVTYSTVSNATKPSNKTATYGSTVTIDAYTPADGYAIKGYTVNNGAVTVTETNGVYTFTMPASNVTVSAQVTPLCTVTVASSDDTMGTATVTPTGSVAQGSTVTLTATAIGSNQFTSWTIEGEHEFVEDTSKNSPTAKVKVNGNITATANFVVNQGTLLSGCYLLYSSKPDIKDWTDGNFTSVPVYKVTTSDNQTKLVARLDTSVISTGTYYAAFSGSSTSFTSAYWSSDTNDGSSISVTSNNTNYVTADASGKNYGHSDSSLGYTNNYRYYVYAQFNISKKLSMLEIYMTGSSQSAAQSSKHYYIDSDSNIPSDAIEVYAKDGAPGTSKYGDTTLTSGFHEDAGEEAHSEYSVYLVEKSGGIINIQTKVDEDDYNNGYYVYAYIINGQTVMATAQPGRCYTAAYSVKADSDDIEITPVYYNKNIEAKNDYITFYVDAYELGDHWGNMIACYSYYYNADNGGTGYGDGTYPGQPMLLNSNGKYYARLARYYYKDGVKKDSLISGITLNNFYENETVHEKFLSSSQKMNFQTYDYDDFVKLSNPELDFDTIEFDIKYRTGTSNQSTLNNGNTGAKDSDKITISTFENSSHNGWDNFVDYDNNRTDILGNAIDETLEPIYIVSTGNQNTDLGTWSTVWYVYDEDGNYITHGNPSAFISAGTGTQTTEYNTMNVDKYLNRPTYICFESEMSASSSTTSNTGVRLDGRWYYTNSTKNQATVTTQVWYSDNYDAATPGDATWALDENNSRGTATIDGETSKVFSHRNVEATISASGKGSYMFIEWGVLDEDGNYQPISTAPNNDHFIVAGNFDLVAKVVKIQGENLVLSHEKYVGPNAVGGAGFYSIKASVAHNDNTTTEYNYTEGNIVIEDLKSTDKSITITLKTECAGNNTFIDWYQLDNEQYQIIGPEDNSQFGQNTAEYTFTLDVADIYSGANNLLINTLYFYSDIARVTADAVLNYKYYDRFGNEKTYVKKLTLDDTYIEANGLIITDDLVYQYAPAVDDLHKDCMWKITEQTTTKNGTTATLWATQSVKKFNVLISYPDSPRYSATVLLNDYLIIEDDKLVGTPTATEFSNLVTAPLTSNDTNFSYWSIEENGKEVGRCYYYKFNLKIAGDYTITAVYGAEGTSLTISDPTYTREQSTNTDGSVVYDYLYVDFIVAFMSSDGVLLNGNLGAGYKTGLIVEFDSGAKVNVPDEEGRKLTEEEKSNATINDNFSIDTFETFVSSGNGSQLYDTDGDGKNNRVLYNFTIDNNKYNNKNRLDYYVRFNNTASFRQYAMRAYYYVIDADGNFTMTDPVYFYLYDIGNSTEITDQTS